MFKMAKKSKLATPEWILQGYDSIEEYNKSKGVSTKKKQGKTFKVRECPECGSDDVGVVLSESDKEEDSGTGQEWECRKCKWKGQDIVVKELNEDELMEYMDKRGEEVA